MNIRFYIFGIFGSFIFILIMTCCHTSTPSQGKKIGHIVKLAKEGVFFKTWEGELIRGGLTDGSGSFGTSFHFVIESDSLAESALNAMENNEEVILYYHCEMISSLSRSEKESPHFVDKICIVHKNKL